MKYRNLKNSIVGILLAILVICCISFNTKVVYFGLPTSGQITMDMVRAELGVPTQANFSLNSARNGVYAPLNPYSPSLPPTSGQVKLSDWYGYCHACTPLYSHTVYIAFFHPSRTGWASSSDACSGSRSTAYTLYSSSSTLNSGATLYELSGGVYYPFTISNSWAYTSTGNKAIELSSNEVISNANCSTTIFWNFDNPYGVLGRTLYIYKNGSVIITRTSTDSGSFSFEPGDNIRVYLQVTIAGNPQTNYVDLTGGYIYSNTSTDSDIDTGTINPSGTNPTYIVVNIDF